MHQQPVLGETDKLKLSTVTLAQPNYYDLDEIGRLPRSLLQTANYRASFPDRAGTCLHLNSFAISQP